jgi:ELWxxDGT repeat protein
MYLTLPQAKWLRHLRITMRIFLMFMPIKAMTKPLYFLASLLLFSTAKAQTLETAPLSEALTMPAAMHVMNGKLLFTASSTVHGKELFSTDGTAAGTSLVKEIGNYYNVPAFGAFQYINSLYSVGYFGRLGNKLYFQANVGASSDYKFWISDGTEAGTMLLAPSLNLQDIRWYKEYNGRLYFTARSNASGHELWSTDGTDAGTVLVKDINPGEGNAFNGGDPKFVVFNNKLWFVADNGTHGAELWNTDGTTGGTTMLKDLNTGYYIDPTVKSAFATSNRKPLVVFNGNLYFEAFDGQQATGGLYTLYKSNGTPGGTLPVMAATVQSGYTPQYRNVEGLTVFNNSLYFFATTTAYNGGVQNGLWKMNADGSGATFIYQVKGYGDNGLSDDIPPGAMREYNGKLYFVGKTNSSDSHFWSSDGTAAGTSMILQLNQNFDSFDTQQYMRSIVYDNKLYFVAGTYADENVYRTDGTTAGTTPVFASNMIFGPYQFTKYANTAGRSTANQQEGDLYFSATPNLSYELYRLKNEQLSTVDFANNIATVYPNPSPGQITIKYQYAVTNASVSLINMAGQRVYSKYGISGIECSIDISTLPAGVYLLHAIADTGSFTTKIAKQ